MELMLQEKLKVSEAFENALTKALLCAVSVRHTSDWCHR